MQNEWQDYADAARIVRELRLEAAGGPDEVWQFLYRVHAYLGHQRDAAFSAAWEELRMPPQSVNHPLCPTCKGSGTRPASPRSE
jgi:hypothetical protein